MITMATGHCRYAFNASEIYQRAKPGMGVELTCGAATFPANDEPEIVPVRKADGEYEYRPTGRHLTRAQPDPFCPAHGGTPEPPPPPVDAADVQQAYAQLVTLAHRYQAQAEPVAAPGEPAGLPPAAPVSEAGFMDWMRELMAPHQSEVTDGTQ